MEYDITLLVVLALVGIVAGGINTVAGGGSNLTLPVLMLLGLPADVANGTNRVAVALQCVVGIRGFRNHDRLDEAAILPILVPTLIGGVFGSLAAAVIPVTYLLLLPLAGAGWALAGAGLLALTPFGLHEILFTWPKWAATAWLAAAFTLVHARQPVAAGLAVGLGFLHHPLVLLWTPWLALWAAGRHGPGGRARLAGVGHPHGPGGFYKASTGIFR
jgi:uncharacterized membrane protein YfcA